MTLLRRFLERWFWFGDPYDPCQFPDLCRREPDGGRMTLFTRHDTPEDELIRQLDAEIEARGLFGRTAVIRAGPKLFNDLNYGGENDGYTILKPIGWIGLVRDPDMEEWSAVIEEREGA